jgi:hypothetical protein
LWYGQFILYRKFIRCFRFCLQRVAQHTLEARIISATSTSPQGTQQMCVVSCGLLSSAYGKVAVVSIVLHVFEDGSSFLTVRYTEFEVLLESDFSASAETLHFRDFRC